MRSKSATYTQSVPWKILCVSASTLTLLIPPNAAGQSESAARTIYVATSGDDAHSGSQAEPLATFQGARDKIRQLHGDGPITVLFRQGHYHFTEPVRLGIEDSGSEDQPITYAAFPGERPVFTSGVQVDGWKKIARDDPFYGALPEAARGECYVADVPSTIMNDEKKRGLFRLLVDRSGGWLERGRYSLAGQIRTPTQSEWAGAVEDAIYYSPDMKKISELNVDITGLAMPPRGMEIMTWLSDWNIGLVPIESATKTDFGSRVKTSIAATYKLAGGARGYHKNLKFVDSALINCPEGIDSPGKWAVNPDAGRVYLWPLSGANLERDLFAPTLSELILVHGRLPEGSAAWLSKEPVVPVRHITFDGITFTNGDFLHWEDTDPVVQHGWGTCDKNDALVRFRGVEHCTVKNCTFTNSGGVGVRFDLYAMHNTVLGCKFTDLGMEAVHFGGYGAGTRDENGHNTVKDCEIGFPGRIKVDNHAITIWNSGFNEITHNYIHDTPYTPVLIAGPRFRVLIRHVDDSVPWKEKFWMQEGAWPMHRWDEIPEVACFTMTVAEWRGRKRLIHQPHPDHPQYPRPSPHVPLDREAAAFRFAQGNRVTLNTFENVSRGAFGEAIYVSGTTEPGARNVVTDNYICNSRDALFPIIWMLYVDGYGRGIDLHRNVVFNSEVTFTGFHLAYWRSYNGWKWKDWQFDHTPPPLPASANVWCDTTVGESLISPAPHAGTICVGCGEMDEKYHQPSATYLRHYRRILRNLDEGLYPYPNDDLPGKDRIRAVLGDVIAKLEEN